MRIAAFFLAFCLPLMAQAPAPAGKPKEPSKVSEAHKRALNDATEKWIRAQNEFAYQAAVRAVQQTSDERAKALADAQTDCKDGILNAPLGADPACVPKAVQASPASSTAVPTPILPPAQTTK